MKSRLKKLLVGFIIGFVVLLILRLTYLLVYQPYESQQQDQTAINSSNLNSEGEASKFYSVRNIATNTVQQVEVAAGTAVKTITTIIQKYERTATITATSTNFDSDEKQLRSVIKKYEALNQYEQNTGLTGDRVLQIAIGVEPVKFDSVVKDIYGVGKPASFDVSIYDKTPEYRELQAKKASLETARNSLEALKQKNGNIDEYINLENRIMELNNELQSLGVNIGDYDKSGNFCTIKFTLTETKALEKTPVMTQAMRAFEWTTGYYLLFLFILLLGSVVALVMVKTYEAFKPSVKQAIDTVSEE
ncbi:MAG: DUF4349 domain-containing protein [Acidobacteriota bacterium]